MLPPPPRLQAQAHPQEGEVMSIMNGFLLGAALAIGYIGAAYIVLHRLFFGRWPWTKP